MNSAAPTTRPDHKSHAYADETMAHRKRREFIQLGFSVSLVAQHPSGYYVFDVLF